MERIFDSIGEKEMKIIISDTPFTKDVKNADLIIYIDYEGNYWKWNKGDEDAKFVTEDEVFRQIKQIRSELLTKNERK